MTYEQLPGCELGIAVVIFIGHIRDGKASAPCSMGGGAAGWAVGFGSFRGALWRCCAQFIALIPSVSGQEEANTAFDHAIDLAVTDGLGGEYFAQMQIAVDRLRNCCAARSGSATTRSPSALRAAI